VLACGRDPVALLRGDECGSQCRDPRRVACVRALVPVDEYGWLATPASAARADLVRLTPSSIELCSQMSVCTTEASKVRGARGRGAGTMLLEFSKLNPSSRDGMCWTLAEIDRASPGSTRCRATSVRAFRCLCSRKPQGPQRRVR
jgi:hypothetical protein